MRRSGRLAAQAAANPPPALTALLIDDDDDNHENPTPHRRRRAPKQRSRAKAAAPLPPELFLKVLKAQGDRIDRWQSAAGLALSGAFGPAWSTHLEPFWQEEADANATFLGHRPNLSEKEVRRAAAVAIFRPRPVPRNLTKSQITALVPRTVPPSIIRAVRDDLPRRRVVKALEAAGLSEFATHRRVRAFVSSGASVRKQKGLFDCLRREQALVAELAEYGLSLRSTNRSCVSYIESGKGLLEDIVSEIVDRQGRRQELEDALVERGLVLRSDSKLCKAYIHEGDGDVDEIVDIMDEMRFYHKYTHYSSYREEIWAEEKGENDYMPFWGRVWVDPEEVSAMAKVSAWEEVLKRKGRNWLLSLSELPPTLRRRLLEAE